VTNALLVLALLAALAAVGLCVLVLRELRGVRARLDAEPHDPAGSAAAIEEAVRTLRQHNQRQHRKTRAVIDGLFSGPPRRWCCASSPSRSPSTSPSW
jgi:hypothetical protein